MAAKTVYSICGMCTVRCPIQVEVENGEVNFLQGNLHFPAMKGAVCPRGAAGPALLKDRERPQTPLIRDGARGEGKWRKATWDEALDHIAEKLKTVMEQHGPRAVALSDRGGPFRDMHRAFLKGLGSPNYVNHDTSCARNVQHAALSVMGMGRKGVSYDLKNSRHVVLQLRNIFEAINVQEVNNLMDAMEKGCKLTVIDIRSTVSASKADHFFLVRPGTDYAFNLAVIHELLHQGLYDKEYARLHIQDLDRLESFVADYGPEWAAGETGVPADRIRAFVRELAAAAPAVLWHPGWMTARYRNSFYVSRTIYLINALLGSIGAKGGLPLVSKPGDVGRKGLREMMSLYPKPEEKRADGAGWLYPHLEAGPGLPHLLYKVMETGDPYPVKAYLCFRHDPLMGFPEPERLKAMFDHLDLLVSITFTWSDTAWYSDVVLPLSMYLERGSAIATKNALSPYFFVRRQAVEPRYDSKSEWDIWAGLARRMGLDELAFETIQDVWKFQLEGTGVSIEDFEKTGKVGLADGPRYIPMEEMKFKTPSGKIEVVSDRLESVGIPSLLPYESPQRPPAEDHFRLTFGRCALHTQGHTVNNPMLFEQMPENVLWIHKGAAARMKIADGETVRVSQNGYSETIKAKVTEFIHPEAVFVIHGFGHTLPVESRAFGRGLADNKFMKGGLDIWDKAGGAVAYQEHFVQVSKL